MSEATATIEPAPSGRAKCRGCARTIERGALRFGERLPNPFADGSEMTVWLHLDCAAFKRPEPLLPALAATTADVPDRDRLERAAQLGVAHPRLPRIDGAERAPSGQAKCRHCQEPIERGTWRIRIGFWEDGRVAPGGYVHLGCRESYFETGDVLERLLQFSPGLDDAEREALRKELAS
jgi:hypothetical protein